MSSDSKTVTRAGVRFDVLAQPQHGAVTDRCCCPWCSPTPGVSADNPAGVWDTRATCLKTGRSWLVHMPELHGRPRLRVSP